ncbi:hypothetical protein GCK32_014977 [Trichostrongylus colubriformis]|uniref:Uncharacterized protein n=1 Tax=Trichostrongylus colubriformis TaxID=6319 RepID=A0AAN8IWK5_TRICO
MSSNKTIITTGLALHKEGGERNARTCFYRKPVELMPNPAMWEAPKKELRRVELNANYLESRMHPSASPPNPRINLRRM